MIEFVEVSEADRQEMRAVNQLVRQMAASQPSAAELGAVQARLEREQGRSWMGPIQYSEAASDRHIDTEHGPLRVRVVVPAEVEGVYFHIHGGGWVLGRHDHQDRLLTTIAEGARLAVVSVDYRLAPEHPFPAGADDCEAAAVWLIERCQAEFGTTRLLIGGESAGAHLAALTLLRLRRRFGSVSPFVAANLTFGVFDLSNTPSSRNWNEPPLVLSSELMQWFADQFVPGRPAEQRRDPALSPLFDELHELVPALFTVGTADPLLDDSLFMGARWRAAGNPAHVVVFPDAPHGFIAFPVEIATQAIARQLAFLRDA